MSDIDPGDEVFAKSHPQAPTEGRVQIGKELPQDDAVFPDPSRIDEGGEDHVKGPPHHGEVRRMPTQLGVPEE